MSDYYNLDGIKTALKKKIEIKKAYLNCWESVEFITKKDGTPFKILSKNIVNARIVKPQYTLQDGENELIVGCWCDAAGYVNDYINIYRLVKDLDDKKRVKTENYLPKHSLLEQVYVFDIEDIKEAVNDRIEQLKNLITQLENELLKVDNIYNNFKIVYGEALEQLKNDCGDGSIIHSMILETVKSRYPYC